MIILFVYHFYGCPVQLLVCFSFFFLCISNPSANPLLMGPLGPDLGPEV